ncbi:MAG: sigma-54-dependent Fis family transcriptional regulator, partial [SAR324 cluster bacterium]|nr:sigma-54-dependent Fis family transcriptional regulator [SAR324 cluster bacterium]
MVAISEQPNHPQKHNRNKDKRIYSILVVDRGKDLFEQFNRVFAEKHFKLLLDRSLEHAFERFEEQTFDILILSSSAAENGEIAGIELLEVITEKCAATQIIFLTHPKQITLAFSALKLGSYQYALLPIADQELRLLLETALEQQPQYPPNLLLKEELRQTSFEDMIGGSACMREIYRQIRLAAMTEMPVLITGETGTGKDLVAHAIHQLSTRKQMNFIPIHLGALPRDLVASELFGHEKGAFTGAWKRYKGSFERAHGGTVFLDEVGTIDEKNQVSLLRLLETKLFNRIGSSRPIKGNVRIIAATNKDLTQAVDNGSFREDLFYRLEVFHISLPPVRERTGDISLLVNHFINRFNDAYKRNILGISPECITRLESYDWPGNVRE